MRLAEVHVSLPSFATDTEYCPGGAAANHWIFTHLGTSFGRATIILGGIYTATSRFSARYSLSLRYTVAKFEDEIFPWLGTLPRCGCNALDFLPQRTACKL